MRCYKCVDFDLGYMKALDVTKVEVRCPGKVVMKRWCECYEQTIKGVIVGLIGFVHGSPVRNMERVSFTKELSCSVHMQT